jgi:hypothetical protein
MMDITVPRNEVIELGQRFRADYLAEQAGYTLGIAAPEGEALSDLLPDEFLNESKRMKIWGRS